MTSSPVLAPVSEPLGRERELTLLRGALGPGLAVLVLGSKGMGKSALLAALRRWSAAAGNETLMVQVTEDKEHTLRRLLASVGMAAEGARGVRKLEASLLRWCDTPGCILFVDDADRASPGLLHTLRRVALETSACLVAAARTGPADAPDRLRRAVVSQHELRLGPLAPSAARALAIASGAPPALVEAIVEHSARVPVAVVELARRCRDARYQLAGRVSWELLLADLRVANRL